MNLLPHFKQTILPLLITTVLACFGLLPTARAVIPAPDGGYPGGNTAEGQAALLSRTTGSFNTAIGYFSLKSDTTGSFNTGTGVATLFANTGDQNTATGAGALLSNTSGSANVATGAFALLSNTTGSSNTATGLQALFGNTTGSFNNAVGLHALISNTTGIDNNALGAAALFSSTTGSENTAVGDLALTANTTGGANTATGSQTLESNRTGSDNTAIGYQALMTNTGDNNTATGAFALGSNTTGVSNTAFGLSALANNTTGTNNQAFGVGAGDNVTTANGVICIYSQGANVDNSCFIGNIRGVTTQNGDAVPVLIDSAGQLGTASSSRRYKTDIKPMDKASESILALKPVSFRYKVHKGTTPQFGLIAEDVAEVNPNLVLYDADGKPYTVRYEAVNAMLLNEFLKEHRQVQEQKTTIAELKSAMAQQQKQIKALTAGFQKVSAQIEASKPAPQVVNNP